MSNKKKESGNPENKDDTINSIYNTALTPMKSDQDILEEKEAKTGKNKKQVPKGKKTKTNKKSIKNSTEFTREKEQKLKVNFYVPNETKDELEDLQYLIRKELDTGDRSKINYSLIAECALRIASEDFEKNKQNSKIFKLISKSIQE